MSNETWRALAILVDSFLDNLNIQLTPYGNMDDFSVEINAYGVGIKLNNVRGLLNMLKQQRDKKQVEITNALVDTIKQAIPGIFVAKQCNQEMQSENFTHQELCISILKQFNAMLAEFNNQTKANVTQLMAESAVQQ
jgi:hypothetical protein